MTADSGRHRLVGLAEAHGVEVGGKTEPLARLLRAGFDVPAGFVVPATGFREQSLRRGLPPRLAGEIAEALDRLTRTAPTGFVAVRSSSSSEDTDRRSAAGQHDSVLAVRGAEAVCAAVLTCRASARSDRAVAYRALTNTGERSDGSADMAVLVQQWVDARVSGVMFTWPDSPDSPDNLGAPDGSGAVTVIEATWGLGDGLVSGRVTPDSWTVDAGAVRTRRPGSKAERGDRVGDRIVTTPVAPEDRQRPCLTHDEALRLHHVGVRIAQVLGGARDIEWALDGDRIRILQARPVTADLPRADGAAPEAGGAAPGARGTGVLRGIPGAAGTATGCVRHVRGPADFRQVGPGDVLVCRETDPAWTPLFTLAGAVVTETGGALSHAAIVAREVGIPAVLAVPEATTRLPAGSLVHVDGEVGAVTRCASDMDQCGRASGADTGREGA